MRLMVIEALQAEINGPGLGRLVVDGRFGIRTATAYVAALRAGTLPVDHEIVRLARLAICASAPPRYTLDTYYGPPPHDIMADPLPGNPEAIRLRPGSNWETLNLAAVDLPVVGRRRLHVRAAPAFIAWLGEVEHHLAHHPEEAWRIKVMQTLAMRFMRGLPGHLSDHARGCGADVNPADNPRGKAGTLPDWFVDLAEAWGFEWGGRWRGRSRDDMHFAWCRRD